jgi:hypothetical protein
LQGLYGPHALVVRLLLSYCQLIQTPVDLDIAKDIYIVPKDVSWESWAVFGDADLTETKYMHVNKCYKYSELRLMATRSQLALH